MDAIPISPEFTGVPSLTMCHATGMVMAQLNVDVHEAQATMSAYAGTVHRSLSDVAGEIVSRRLRLGEPLPSGERLYECLDTLSAPGKVT